MKPRFILQLPDKSPDWHNPENSECLRVCSFMREKGNTSVITGLIISIIATAVLSRE